MPRTQGDKLVEIGRRLGSYLRMKKLFKEYGVNNAYDLRTAIDRRKITEHPLFKSQQEHLEQQLETSRLRHGIATMEKDRLATTQEGFIKDIPILREIEKQKRELADRLRKQATAKIDRDRVTEEDINTLLPELQEIYPEVDTALLITGIKDGHYTAKTVTDYHNKYTKNRNKNIEDFRKNYPEYQKINRNKGGRLALALARAAITRGVELSDLYDLGFSGNPGGSEQEQYAFTDSVASLPHVFTAETITKKINKIVGNDDQSDKKRELLIKLMTVVRQIYNQQNESADEAVERLYPEVVPSNLDNDDDPKTKDSPKKEDIFLTELEETEEEEGLSPSEHDIIRKMLLKQIMRQKQQQLPLLHL